MKNKIYDAIKNALGEAAFVDEITISEVGTITVEVSGIDEDEEGNACEIAIAALKKIGIRTTDSDAETYIGKF